MPDLSACYFCGIALDEPLSEYPVVPKTLQPAPDQQRTIVLCSGCRRKLGRVLDSVLDALDDRPIDATVQQEIDGTEAGASGRSGGASDATAAEGDDEWMTPEEVDGSGDDTAVADASGVTEAADVGSDEEDADATPEEEGADVADESNGDTDDISAAASASSGWSTVNVKHSHRRRRSDSDSDASEGPSESSTDDGAADEAGQAGGADESAADEGERAADEAETGADQADTGADQAETGTDTDSGAAADAGSASSTDGTEPTESADGTDDGSAAGGDQSLTRLEYSKVMRLLENREFPVDREEIEVVATNAYEIRPQEFDAIVDAAIDRGLLVEDNGKFVEMD